MFTFVYLTLVDFDDERVFVCVEQSLSLFFFLIIVFKLLLDGRRENLTDGHKASLILCFSHLC